MSLKAFFDEMSRLVRRGTDPWEILEKLRVFSYKSNEDPIDEVVFSDRGNLIVALDGYAIFSDKFKQLSKVKIIDRNSSGEETILHFIDLSYCCGKILLPGPYSIFVAHEDGTLWKRLFIPWEYRGMIRAVQNGFITCSADICLRYDFDLNIKWKLDLTDNMFHGDFAINKDRAYIGTNRRRLVIVDVNSGKVTSEVKIDDMVREIVTCGNRLLLVDDANIHLYDISDRDRPRKLWSSRITFPTEELSVAFSPDCEYITIASGTTLMILDASGRELLSIPVDAKAALDVSEYADVEVDEVTYSVYSVSWWRNRLAFVIEAEIDTYLGTNYVDSVYVYELDPQKLPI